MRNYMRWLGMVLMAVGALGFVPGVTKEGMLLGVFHVDPLHNLVHLVTGGALWYASSAEEPGAGGLLKALAVVYGLVTVLGFMAGDGAVLGLMANNMADNFLHLGLAAVFAYWGFGNRDAATV